MRQIPPRAGPLPWWLVVLGVALLLRLVYHHFQDPARMRSSLRQALRPGGLIVIIDLEPRDDWGQLSGVPDRGGHGVPASEVVEDMTAAGFEVMARFDEWAGEPDYCLVFKRSGLSG